MESIPTSPRSVIVLWKVLMSAMGTCCDLTTVQERNPGFYVELSVIWLADFVVGVLVI